MTVEKFAFSKFANNMAIESNMKKNQRKQYILTQIKRYGKVRNSDLCKKLKVSRETIRKDIYELSDSGEVHLIRGGAEAYSVERNSHFEKKRQKNIDLKRQIANASIDLLHNGDSIFLDAGTTSLEIAKALTTSTIENLTVVTNSTFVIEALQFYKNIRLLVLGGIVRAGEGSLSGRIINSSIQDMYITYGFFGSSGISKEAGITNPFLEEAQSCCQIFQHCKYGIVVADHTKFGQQSLVKMFNLNDVTAIITDNNLDIRKINSDYTSKIILAKDVSPDILLRKQNL